MRDLTYTIGKLSVINGHNNIGDVWFVVMNFLFIHRSDVDCDIHDKSFAFYQTLNSKN